MTAIKDESPYASPKTATSLPQTDAARPHQDVPVKKRFLWGIGGFADCLMYNGINGLVDPIYNMGMGIDARLIGWARGLPRLVDLLIDPVIGHLSDNTRSRWGRRRPWMLAGALLAAAICIIMWFVPLGAGRVVSNTFVVVMMVLLFTFGYSLFVIPYNGQGYGLSTDYNERTHLFKWRQYTFAFAGFLSPGLFWLCTRIDRWGYGLQGDEVKGLRGIQWVGPALGLVILATACVPIFFCREGNGEQARKHVPFLDAIRYTLDNRAFWPLVGGNFLLKFGMCSTGNFFNYVIMYNLCGGDRTEGSLKWWAFCLVINIATFVAMALVVRCVDAFGKKPMLLALLLASSAAYGSVYFTFRPYSGGMVAQIAGWLSAWCYLPTSLASSWPIFVTAACIGIFCNCLPLLMNSMLADVCDVDELASGHQRQAFYGAMFATCDKIAMGAAMFLQGILLAASGYHPEEKIASPETIAWWFKALLFSQPTGFVVAFAIVLFYPITRARAAETRRLLDLRASRSHR